MQCIYWIHCFRLLLFVLLSYINRYRTTFIAMETKKTFLNLLCICITIFVIIFRYSSCECAFWKICASISVALRAWAIPTFCSVSLLNVKNKPFIQSILFKFLFLIFNSYILSTTFCRWIGERHSFKLSIFSNKTYLIFQTSRVKSYNSWTNDD